MDMRVRSIERSDWAGFVDAFSRQHEGWLVSLSVGDSDEGERRFLARDVPLRGIYAEHGVPGEDIVVLTGEPTPHLSHVIASPAALRVTESDEGADAAVADGGEVEAHAASAARLAESQAITASTPSSR